MSNELELLLDIANQFHLLAKRVKEIDNLSTQLGNCFYDCSMNYNNPKFPDKLLAKWMTACIKFRKKHDIIDSKIYNLLGEAK
jgi:hypothetical protein